MPKADGNGLRKAARKLSWLLEDREKDPERIWKISGSAALQGKELALLRALWIGEMPKLGKPIGPVFKSFGMKNSLNWRNRRPRGTCKPRSHSSRENA